VLRPTWHFVAPGDLRWLMALTAPRVRRASAYQYRLFEIDGPLAARARGVIEAALEGGLSRTREELGNDLRAAGIDATSVRLAYLVGDAELEAAICSGPRKGKRQTYALVDERVPPAPPRTRDAALTELALRYVQSHGPAQAADLAWWSGLTLTDARIALESATPPLVRERVGQRTFYASAAPPVAVRSPSVHLLPNYDELLVAFRDRSDMLDPGLPVDLRVAQVILGHVVVRDGLVVGSFRRRDERASTRLDLEIAVPLDAVEREAVGAEVRRFETFIGRSVAVTGLD
jgi:hypothetical protein